MAKEERPAAPGLSRRRFGQLVGGGTAAVAAGALLGAEPAQALVPRAHGPVLTAGYSTWQQAVANAAHNLNKVVTGWGAPPGGWENNPDFVWTACGMSNFTIVRTVTGDTWNYIDANQAVDEIRRTRFYEYKADQQGPDKCIIELGNEPNIGCPDVWTYASLLSQTIDKIRTNFPGAKICSTALSPQNFNGQGDSRYPRNWLYNSAWRNAVAKCDFVGVHFYSNDGNFANQGAYNEMTYKEVLSIAAQQWPGKPVIATEYSIRNGWSRYDKGWNYANLIHFDGTVASNLWGATYYHIMTASSPDPGENVGSEGAVGYRDRLNRG